MKRLISIKQKCDEVSEVGKQFSSRGQTSTEVTNLQYLNDKDGPRIVYTTQELGIKAVAADKKVIEHTLELSSGNRRETFAVVEDRALFIQHVFDLKKNHERYLAHQNDKVTNETAKNFLAIMGSISKIAERSDFGTLLYIGEKINCHTPIFCHRKEDNIEHYRTKWEANVSFTVTFSECCRVFWTENPVCSSDVITNDKILRAIEMVMATMETYKNKVIEYGDADNRKTVELPSQRTWRSDSPQYFERYVWHKLRNKVKTLKTLDAEYDRLAAKETWINTIQVLGAEQGFQMSFNYHKVIDDFYKDALSQLATETE